MWTRVRRDEVGLSRAVMRAGLCMAALVLLAGAAYGQNPPITQQQNFEIRGYVRTGDTGHSLENTRVDLKVLHGPVIGTTYTRSNGEFQFPGLRNGVYYVEVNLEGYEPFRESVEVFQRSPAPVMVMLRKPIGMPARVEGSIVSARELALPEKSRNAWNQGRAKFYQNKDFKGGLKEFQRVVEASPEFYEAYFQMGMVYQEMGQMDEAKKSYLQSVEVSKGQYAEPLISLAGIRNNEYDFAEAEVYTRKALAVDANSYLAYYELARALLGQNKLDEAILAAEQCRVRKPEFAPLYLQLANVHIRRKNGLALLGALEEYLKYEPKGPMSQEVRKRADELRSKLAGGTAPTPKP